MATKVNLGSKLALSRDSHRCRCQRQGKLDGTGSWLTRSLKIMMFVAMVMMIFSACGDKSSRTSSEICEKIPMQSDGIVRLSKIQVNPKYLDEYIKFAVEVGTTSLEAEPGVLTMYAVADKENPCNITILETYASQEAYKSHIASEHFQKYKQGTLHMVDSLLLDDVTPLNPRNTITNTIKR
ncbi:MAG: antibiotic biosynthesis monooxygenase [Muribaculaceae bacterium]|nr:antibiotic biosynthesis monooxygenase [Muribaculaceae bacterium]